MWQITKCDGKDSWIVAICDCRILWRFKMQLLRFMSVMQEGILLSAGNMYTSTSDTINNAFMHACIHARTYVRTCLHMFKMVQNTTFRIVHHYGLYNWYTDEKMYQWNNTRIGKYETFHIHAKSDHGYSPKSFIFAHYGVISMLYLFVCMYISYKAHNRFTKETLLIVSDVDVYMFPALRSIPSCTTDMNLRSCILNRHKMRQSQIATIQESLPSHFVICRILWSWPWRHKLSPITLKTCSGYLGEYPG